MAFTRQQLDKIYNRTSGFCHLCHKKLARINYGNRTCRGGWEVEHSNPRSKGGTDHPNNLFAACVQCNVDKGNRHTRTARAWNGKSCAPLGREKRKQAKFENGLAVATLVGLAGAALAGPFGAVVGATAGVLFGSSQNPDQRLF